MAGARIPIQKMSLFVSHVTKHLQWQFVLENISWKGTSYCVGLHFLCEYFSWAMTAREDELILFCAAIKIISPLFQKSTDDMSQPEHHRQGKVSIPAGFYLFLLLLLVRLRLLLLLLLLHLLLLLGIWRSLWHNTLK